jgi:hypothetical protein
MSDRLRRFRELQTRQNGPNGPNGLGRDAERADTHGGEVGTDSQSKADELHSLPPTPGGPLGPLGPKRGEPRRSTWPAAESAPAVEQPRVPPWRRVDWPTHLAPANDEPPPPDPGALLLAALDRLSRRYPDGVERGLLRSNFVLELAARRERAGLPKLSPAENVAAFDAALHRAAHDAPRGVVARGELLRRGARKGAKPKPSVEPPAVKAEAAPALAARCRCCGGVVDWSRPGGIGFADGGSAHLVCYDAAEPMPRGEPPP